MSSLDRRVRSAVDAARRLARRSAIGRAAYSAVGPLRWARVIERSGVVDTEYVEAQLGRRTSIRRAVRRYVAGGFRRGLRLNPLFVDGVVGDQLPGASRVPPLYAYLVADPRTVPVSPLWDAAAYLHRHPDRATELGGALGAVWRRREKEQLPFGPTANPIHVNVLLEAARSAAAAARGAADAELGANAQPVGAELVLILDEDEREPDESLAEAAGFLADGDAVAIAVLGGPPETWAQIAMLAIAEPRIRAVRLTGRHQEAVQRLLDTSGAQTIVLRGPDMRVAPAAMRALSARAGGGALVAPLWLDADGTIAAAGAARDGRILAGHPREDAADLGDGRIVRVPAVAGPVFAAPVDLMRDAVAGKDPARRASTVAVDRGVVAEVALDAVARSRVAAPRDVGLPGTASSEELLRAAGWRSVTTGPAPRMRRAAREAVTPDGRRVPVLRWALKTAAPADDRAEAWGDTHFARGIASALRRLGQEVVIDAFPARSRRTAHLDDVTLVLRGPESIDPPETGIRMQWVISHPDEVAAAGPGAFDLVFAASEPWARRMSALWSRPVLPLTQCTDAQRFHPSGLPRNGRAVFVGTARGIYRPSVVAPIDAGIDVDVYGPDWRDWIPAERIRAVGIPNDELPAIYETAGLVLNDHWPAMRVNGFIGNRLYDVVAAGGRAISDDVEGIAETFAGAVLTYRSTTELIEMLSGNLDRLFPDDVELDRISRVIRDRDSFDGRAATLLDAALQLR